ncbi:MFS transporter, partial [Nocardioides sp. YIM 152588]|uniref:MFS transporter n=1 Tax=Nocardioides sp. YIM 152588 TaxID=3158259 RepID=UPI0032E4FCC2
MTKQSQGIAAAVTVGAAFLAGADLFIVNVAFDDIARDLGGGSTTLARLSWVLTAYAVVFAALLVPFGRAGDRYGARRVFLGGLVVFTAASAACAVAGDVETLIGFRVVQAVGAAAMTPASLGLLLAALPPERRPRPARAWALEEAGFLVTNGGYVDSGLAEGTVAYSEPGAGTM